MNRHDTDGHSAHLDTLLLEAGDLGHAFAASELATCGQCAQLVEDHAQLTYRLDALGEEERDSLQAALVGPAPASGSAEARLWEHATSSPTRNPGGLVQLFGVLAAAAAVVAVIVLWKPADGTLAPSTILGGDAPLVEPTGNVADFGDFRWKQELPPEGWFTISVYRTTEAGVLELLTTSPRLEQNHWGPDEEVHLEWPDRILWKLETHSGSMATDSSRSSLQSAQRLP